MNRFICLCIPALAALAVGVLATLVLGLGFIEVRGGLAAAAAVCFALAAIVSLLGIVAIDQTSSRIPVGGGRDGSTRDIASQPLRLSAALAQTYLGPFTPIAALSAGLGLLVSIGAHGLWPGGFVSVFGGIRYGTSEVCMTALLLVWSISTAWLGRMSAAIGCAIGIVVASIVGEAVFSGANFTLGTSLVAWGGGLVAVIMVVVLIRTVRRRSRRARTAYASGDERILVER